MRKKFMKILASALTVASLSFGMIGSTVNAANTTDRLFSFYVTTTRWGGAGYTGVEEKENSTSVYIKLNTDRSVRVETQGSRNQTSNFSNYTLNASYATVKTGEWFIYNNIYERLGNSYARLAIWANTTDGNASGYWSPDSVGDYPVVNK